MKQRSHWLAAVFLLLPVSAASNSGIIQVTGRPCLFPPPVPPASSSKPPARRNSTPTEAHDPDRLYFDILHARPLINGHRYATRQVGDTLVSRVRVAETTPGTTRIVFDLIGQVQYSVSRLDAPDRIVIELTPSGRERAFAQITPALTTFVAPPPARRPEPVIAIPDTPLAIDTTAFAPYQLADSWTSLANVRASHKPGPRTLHQHAGAPAAPYTRTVTTRVLPPMRISGTSATAKASTDASLSLTRALGLKINRIVIDAGHGGHDDGTIGPNGVLEKDVVLDVALRLAALVNSRMGAEVVLTRSDDTFVPLTENATPPSQTSTKPTCSSPSTLTPPLRPRRGRNGNVSCST